MSVVMCIVGFVACGVRGPSNDDGEQAAENRKKLSRVANQLRIEARVRSFDFLRQGEVAVDVLIRNVGGNPMILDLRKDRRPSREQKGSGIVQPYSLLDLLTFRPIGVSASIAKEERTSNTRRRRDPLEEGAVFQSLVQLLPLLPGKAIGVSAIIWSKGLKSALGSTVKEVEVEFNGLALATTPEEIKVNEHFLFGTTLMNQDKWESKEYSEVSVVGRFALVE
jgi:hypothetical protein